MESTPAVCVIQSVSGTAITGTAMKNIVATTIRIARLKLLFIAAKVVKDGNRDKVKYSVHDARTSEMLSFLRGLGKRRSQTKPWTEPGNWSQRFPLPA